MRRMLAIPLALLAMALIASLGPGLKIKADVKKGDPPISTVGFVDYGDDPSYIQWSEKTNQWVVVIYATYCASQAGTVIEAWVYDENLNDWAPAECASTGTNFFTPFSTDPGEVSFFYRIPSGSDWETMITEYNPGVYCYVSIKSSTGELLDYDYGWAFAQSQ